MSRKNGYNQEVFIVADNILSPLGRTTADNFLKLTQSISGVKKRQESAISNQPFSASLFDENDDLLTGYDHYTKFEKLLILSVADALHQTNINPADDKTGLIISTTKGNISLLEHSAYNDALKKRIALHTSAGIIQQHFGFVNQPIVVSNACISGVVAILTALRLIRSGQYDNMVVTGADVISKFIFSGFQSFNALSQQRCRPFDKDRNGINLGEGAATLILSSNKKYAGNIQVLNGSVSDDANHISGPSRTGEELALAIRTALNLSGITNKEVGMISAHGTATLYNDEMEASAITIAGLAQVPVTGLKAHYGHTLGAAGLIESIVSIKSLQQNLLLPTLGFQETGTKPVNINLALETRSLNYCLKTSSGFGGCNAALVFGK
jgi:3-oxoacyl-[acyl-carrier-protein] synthase-1